jgi:8-oxo-dGTP pyrophosphatase MutT (NUDIX family)
MNEAALKGDVLKSRRVRPTAICVFRQDDRIFVLEGYDPMKKQTFYRPLGGSIEFGERGHDTVVRELSEEADVEVTNVRYLGTVENIFTYNGQMGHEIVLLYEGDFADPAIYEKPWVECHEDDETPFRAVWKSLDEFNDVTPLYPDGLLGLITSNNYHKE